MKQKVISCFTAFLMGVSLVSGNIVNAADQQKMNMKDGYEWEYWNSNGAGKIEMNVGNNGIYECSWNDVEECIFKSGYKLGSTQTWDYYTFMTRCSYSIDYKPEGVSYIGYYGWTEDPLVEYYIVEAWGTWRPGGLFGEKEKILISDGKSYDIYSVDRINQPSIHGTEMFKQYWSVAQNNPAVVDKMNSIRGAVTLSNHFKAWEENGMKLGKMYELSMQVSCYQGSGYAKVKPGFNGFEGFEGEMENVVGDNNTETTTINTETTVTDVTVETVQDVQTDISEETTVTDVTSETVQDVQTDISEETTVTDVTAETVQDVQTDISEETTVTDVTAETVQDTQTDISEETTVTDVSDTDVTTENSTDENEPLYGDVDENGVVELTDLTVLSVYLLGGNELSDSQLIKANVYKDEFVDIADLARLKQYICKDPVVLEGGLLKTITDKLKSGNEDGYDWELWNDDDIGTAEMTIGSIGNYSCSWSNVRNCIFKSGKKLGCTKTADEYGGLTWTYDVDFSPNGNAYMGIYGWTEDPTVEYYIVESWGTWRPPGIRDKKGILQSDGRNYDVYTVTRYNQPSIHGTETYEQYWDVAQTNPACAYTKKNIKGSINISNHFRNWEKLGLRTGRLYEISFCIEAYNSSGSADIKQNRPYY